jgi:hypothetical protein
VILRLRHRAIVRISIAQSPITQSLNLFHFFMRRVLAATVAEFLEFQPLGRRLPIFGRRVVPLFAVTTL